MFIPRVLGQQPPRQHQRIANLRAPRACGDAAEMTTKIAQGPARMSVQPAQRFPHMLELAGTRACVSSARRASVMPMSGRHTGEMEKRS